MTLTERFTNGAAVYNLLSCFFYREFSINTVHVQNAKSGGENHSQLFKTVSLAEQNFSVILKHEGVWACTCLCLTVCKIMQHPGLCSWSGHS